MKMIIYYSTYLAPHYDIFFYFSNIYDNTKNTCRIVVSCVSHNASQPIIVLIWLKEYITDWHIFIMSHGDMCLRYVPYHKIRNYLFIAYVFISTTSIVDRTVWKL